MKKTLLRTFLTLFFLLLYLPRTFSAEKYFVENDFVLLYKLINWWYSCEEDDCGFLCGRKLKIEISGSENISLNKNSLTIRFSDLLAHVPPGKVFSKNRKSFLSIYEKKMTFSLTGFSAKKRKYIRKNLKSLSVIVEGTIHGIHNSDIMILNGKADRKCPDLKDDAVIYLVNGNRKNVIEEYYLYKK